MSPTSASCFSSASTFRWGCFSTPPPAVAGCVFPCRRFAALAPAISRSAQVLVNDGSFTGTLPPKQTPLWTWQMRHSALKPLLRYGPFVHAFAGFAMPVRLLPTRHGVTCRAAVMLLETSSGSTHKIVGLQQAQRGGSNDAPVALPLFPQVAVPRRLLDELHRAHSCTEAQREGRRTRRELSRRNLLGLQVRGATPSTRTTKPRTHHLDSSTTLCLLWDPQLSIINTQFIISELVSSKLMKTYCLAKQKSRWSGLLQTFFAAEQ